MCCPPDRMHPSLAITKRAGQLSIGVLILRGCCCNTNTGTALALSVFAVHISRKSAPLCDQRCILDPLALEAANFQMRASGSERKLT